jgi:hypothetical protein
MKTQTLLLILIVIFAAFIRLYHINTLPPSLFYDEVDAGYQAMVFNQNQSDYYGNKFPINFHSFGDYRTSLQIYSVALSERLTHNPELSIRLPSAVFGILSVIIIFFITKSIIPSFLLAIFPWAIHYSRIGFEVSGMIMVLLTGIYFWQKYLNTSKFKYLLSAIFFFCLSPYFYSTANLFFPIIAILVLIIWHRNILKINIKRIIICLLFGVLLLTPLITTTLGGKSGFRFSYIGIFTMPHREQVTNQLRYEDILLNHSGQIGVKTPLISQILHNKYQLVLQKFTSNYFLSFSTDFLFLTGDNNTRQGFGGHGLLYLIDAPLLLIGLFFYFKKRDKIGTLFLGMLLLAPVPFALTRDSTSAHATRLILMLPSIIYFVYLGIKNIQLKYPLSIYLIILLYGCSFFNFWHYYNHHYPQESARYWNMSMKEAVIATAPYSENTLVFSDSYLSFVSFFLFYHPYILNPQSSLADHLKPITNNSFSGQVLDNKYYFGHINWTNLSSFPPDTIYVIPSSESTIGSFQIINTIDKKYLNQEGFLLLKSK